MRARRLPSISTLRDAIAIDPATGLMTWKRRPDHHFRTSADADSWNGQFPGTPAFATLIGGYLHGVINGSRFRAHRVAFALYSGRDPLDEIDHLDGTKTNNSEANLREVSSSENKRNLAVPAHNSSGAIGVSFASSKGRWRAYIGLGGRRAKHLGYFETRDDALQARKAAEQRLGYHPNHGRCAA